jgi:hypothetical protein
MDKAHFFVEVFGKIILVSGLLAANAGITRADVDCSSIAACTIPRPDSGYDPAFQANISGSYHVDADIFLDASCQTIFDTASANGSFTGLITLEYVLDPPMMSGDVVSWKLRFDGCPQTDCLTAVAGTDICQGF